MTKNGLLLSTGNDLNLAEPKTSHISNYLV